MQAPAAKREVLILLAGVLWSAVGLVLIVMGLSWLSISEVNDGAPLTFGIIGGYIVYRRGFSKLAGKNLTRISEQAPGKDKVCVFAFQNRRSYILVAVMILLGYTLRHSPVPKVYLSPIYLTIGLGLLLSSLLYYNRLRH